jgi:hypothetical protein
MNRRPASRRACGPVTGLVAGLAALLLLGACASKEERVHAGLLDIGLSARTASCLAPPLARDLSTAELRKLGRLAHLRNGDARAINIDLLLKQLSALDDGHILAVASRAALGCALSF